MQRYTDWLQKFGHQLKKNVVMLTGDLSVDLKLLKEVSLSPILWCEILLM